MRPYWIDGPSSTFSITKKWLRDFIGRRKAASDASEFPPNFIYYFSERFFILPAGVRCSRSSTASQHANSHFSIEVSPLFSAFSRSNRFHMVYCVLAARMLGCRRTFNGISKKYFYEIALAAHKSRENGIARNATRMDFMTFQYFCDKFVFILFEFENVISIGGRVFGGYQMNSLFERCDACPSESW